MITPGTSTSERILEKMTYRMSIKPISQSGQVLLVVVKNGALDRSGNPYIMQQVPQDFADYLLTLQDAIVGLQAGKELLQHLLGLTAARTPGILE